MARSFILDFGFSPQKLLTLLVRFQSAIEFHGIGKQFHSAFYAHRLVHTSHVFPAIAIPSLVHSHVTLTPAHVSKLLSTACRIIGGELK